MGKGYFILGEDKVESMEWILCQPIGWGIRGDYNRVYVFVFRKDRARGLGKAGYVPWMCVEGDELHTRIRFNGQFNLMFYFHH